MYSTNILRIREDNDLSQRQLGEIINVNRVSISYWETGKQIPSIYKAMAIYEHFNVSLDYIYNLSNVKKYNNVVRKDLDLNVIAKRIRKVRDDNNLTLRDLAKELNTSSSTISAYETAKHLILSLFALQICKRYNVSTDWLYGLID